MTQATTETATSKTASDVGCRMLTQAGALDARTISPLDPLPSGPFRPAVMVTVVVMDPRRWRALATATQPRREEGK